MKEREVGFYSYVFVLKVFISSGDFKCRDWAVVAFEEKTGTFCLPSYMFVTMCIRYHQKNLTRVNYFHDAIVVFTPLLIALFGKVALTWPCIVHVRSAYEEIHATEVTLNECRKLEPDLFVTSLWTHSKIITGSC